MGKLPIVIHHVISKEDYMREELIQTIRNYFRLDKNDFSKMCELGGDWAVARRRTEAKAALTTASGRSLVI